MSEIIVFGAGGRAGRTAVAEALRRGHRVTAVVRDPAGHGDLAADGVRVVAGDVTDADGVARLAEGHGAAINAAADLGSQPDVFFPAASRALLDGLARAGVDRLVAVGLASGLKSESGALLMDTPGYPQEYRGFYLGHAAGTEVLRTATTTLDWVVLSPAGDFDHGGARTGRYRQAAGDAASRISYADFAIALLDEIDTPRHHRTHLGVEEG
ncbi:NAD(P)-dependent oxidoreductase [Streptosporangium sp. NPDC003464]